MDIDPRQQGKPILANLQTFKKLSKELQHEPTSLSDEFFPLFGALMELENYTQDPKVFKISVLFQNLQLLRSSLLKSRGFCVGSVIDMHVTKRTIVEVAKDIEGEVQAWIDELMVKNLVFVLTEGNESLKVRLLKDFETRVSQGLDEEFQEFLLRVKVLGFLSLCMCSVTCSKSVQEHIALAIYALVRVNKEAFGGLAFLGRIVPVLLLMESHRAIQVLCNFVQLFKTSFANVIQLSGQMNNLISLLDSDDFLVQEAALDCILCIGYYGRKEVIVEMLEHGLIEMLVKLQRSKEELNTDMNNGSYSNFVTWFVAKLEKGKGLKENEKRELKWEILRRVKEVSVSEAEAVSIIEDTLWNSLP